MAEVGRWKPYTQRQGQLLPAFVEDALDPGDPVFFINDAVDSLDLMPLEQRYAMLGEHAYSPRLLLKLWLYAATQGVYSGREIARRLRRDLAFRYLAGDGLVPDFRTVNRFRLRHRDDFAWVLRETVRLARAAGLGQLGLVTIDGTKVRANTSRHKAMSHGRMVAEEARLERECAAIVARMEEVNAAEDTEHGEDDDGSGSEHGRAARGGGSGQRLSHRAQPRDAARTGAALSNRRRARGAAASAVATGTGDATDASAPAAAVGAGPVRAAQDAGGAPARRDQGRDGLAALHAARGGEGARGVGSRVRGLQPAAAARNRSRVRLTRAGEAAPPARGAE